jgi:hypothetical protein
VVPERVLQSGLGLPLGVMLGVRALPWFRFAC